MNGTAAPDEKLMKLRYAGVCRECGTERAANPVTEPTAIDPGTVGASTRREAERRRQRREDRVRKKHPGSAASSSR